MSNVITHVFQNHNVRTVDVDGTPMFIAKAVSETGMHWDLAVVDLLLEDDA